jgi:hypothetical protein
MESGTKKSPTCPKEIKYFLISQQATLQRDGKSFRNIIEILKTANSFSRLQIATEYQGGNTGTSSEQIYTNTTVTVKEPEPGLGAKFHKHGKIESTNPYTKDGGKTWIIDRVAIPAKLPGTEFKGA